MSKRTTRRVFLKRTATGLAVAAAAPGALGANEKLHHACIGVGGMGWGDLHNFKSHPDTRIVAICDVDANHLDRAAKVLPDARRYTDWREMLEKEGDRIDSLNVTVPDHMHAAITMTALKAGKHVYCQKPLCHDVAECRAVTAAAGRAGVVTQLGTQHASGSGDRMTVQMLREGVIGKIKRVILCSNRPGAERYRLVGPRPKSGQAPPPSLAWDLWIGTAPMRPYAPGIYHPMLWRSWQDFGTGWSGDIGCHIFSAVWKGLELTAPRTVIAAVQESWKNSPARRADTWPQSDHVTWTFPPSDKTAGDELPIEWFDGQFFPPADVRKLAEVKQYPPESAMLIGTDGALLLRHQGGPRLLPSAKFKGYKYPRIPGRSHWHNFLNACLGRRKPESPFSMAGPMTETVLLGTVAIRVPDTPLKWDAAAMKITNDDEAQKLLRRTYRKGWRVEGL
ncbi:MAG: Gfo/Idh/MocA family oxidoreductase [Planctomycetes bacterium]|nr:Gfo/Idh/MocA family oxidoreductase [Planctomycetota bacterium]